MLANMLEALIDIQALQNQSLTWRCLRRIAIRQT
jgi:hypothetical protein